MIRNETFRNGVCIAADVIDLDAGTWAHEEGGAIVEGPRPLTDAEWMAYDPPPDDGVLDVDRWTIPADAVDYAVVTAGTGDDTTAHFVVDGVVVDVTCERGRAVLEIAVAAPGAVDIRWRDRQATIIGVTP